MPNFRKQRIAAYAVRTVTALLIFSTVGLILWRVFFSANMPKNIDALTPNASLREAYAAHGDEISLLYQDQASITRAEKNYGYFSVPECVFIPEANQVQVVFRYNNGTLTDLARDYGMAKAPDKSGEYFDVTLVRTRDLTPENADDNDDPATLEKERFWCDPTLTVRETTSLYTYYRYTFTGVSVEDVTAGVFVDIYYNADIDYHAEAYGTLCVYAKGEEWLEHGFTREDKRGLTD